MVRFLALLVNALWWLISASRTYKLGEEGQHTRRLDIFILLLTKPARSVDAFWTAAAVCVSVFGLK
jgi:hypothetical protein